MLCNRFSVTSLSSFVTCTAPWTAGYRIIENYISGHGLCIAPLFHTTLPPPLPLDIFSSTLPLILSSSLSFVASRGPDLVLCSCGEYLSVHVRVVKHLNRPRQICSAPISMTFVLTFHPKEVKNIRPFLAMSRRIFRSDSSRNGLHRGTSAEQRVPL